MTIRAFSSHCPCATPSPASPIPFSARRAPASSPRRTSRMASAVSDHRPRRFPLRWRRSQASVPDQFLIGQATPHDGTNHLEEAPAVVVGAVVEAKRLLVKVAEQMERLHV